MDNNVGGQPGGGWSLRNILGSIESIISGFLLVSLVLLLFSQVIARYVFGQSLSWAEEVSRFGLLGLVYISAAMGAQMGTHIRVSAHLLLLPRRAQAVVLFVADLIWLLFNVVVIWQSIVLIISMNARPLESGALQLNMQYVFVLIPIGFFFQSVRLIERWWSIIFAQTTALPELEE